MIPWSLVKLCVHIVYIFDKGQLHMTLSLVKYIFIVITVLWKYIFLFQSLYFCQLTAIYCNLLATPLFKSQTLQFIASGSKSRESQKTMRGKNFSALKMIAYPATCLTKIEERTLSKYVKMFLYSRHLWRRWWRRWRLKSVRQLETKTCLQRKEGCFEKLGEGLYTTSSRDKLWSYDS